MLLIINNVCVYVWVGVGVMYVRLLSYSTNLVCVHVCVWVCVGVVCVHVCVRGVGVGVMYVSIYLCYLFV